MSAGRGGRPPRQVRKLSRRLDVARQLHDLEQDAALELVEIERLRVTVNRSLWTFLAVGLLFTTTGVHDFLAGDLTPADPVWWGCWGVEPCLAGILITVLRWEAAMIARDIEINSRVVDWLKRFLLACTLVMNVVPALFPRHGGISPGMLAAHVMVPVLVFLLAEVMPVVQARCMQARRAVTLTTPATRVPDPDNPTPAQVPVPVPVSPVQAPAPPVVSATPVEPVAAPVEALAVSLVASAAVTDSTPVTRTAPQAPTPVAAAAVELDGLGIPAAMQDRIRQLAAESPTPPTAADIQRATRLPLPIAAKVADRLTPVAVNGY